MGVFYEMFGDIEVRNCQEVQEIVDRFNDVAGSDLYIETLDGMSDNSTTLQFVGGVYCSYTTTSELDDIAQELGEFVIKAGVIHTESDGEDGTLYIGPENQEENTLSNEALENIKTLIGDLTSDDLDKLVIHIEDANTYRKSR